MEESKARHLDQTSVSPGYSKVGQCWGWGERTPPVLLLGEKEREMLGAPCLEGFSEFPAKIFSFAEG